MARVRLRRRAAAVGALIMAATLAVATVVRVTTSGNEAREHLTAYVQAWNGGNDAAAAALTDVPKDALRDLKASRSGLDGGRVSAAFDRIDQRDGKAIAAVRVRWEVPRVGAWSYRVRVQVSESDDGWKVVWRAGNIHPRLDARTRLGTSRTGAKRGRLLDRDGRELVADRPVVDVAVQVDQVKRPASTASQLAALLDVDEQELTARISRAPAGRFVPVVTVRKRDFNRVAGRLRRVTGVSLAESEAPLAPTKTFARALLGAVAPATAEQLKEAKGRLGSGDAVGQWGVQAAYDRRLSGTATRRIVIRRRADGTETRELLSRPGRPGADLRLTLDAYVQGAAEDALGRSERNAALVAVQPSTGDILAVANRPAGSSYDRARLGLYPPGSTFKVISTAALLRDGLSVDEVVDCPATYTVDGRSFRNFEGGRQGRVPFAVDFAQSCNTAFVALADRLGRGALSRTARDYGFSRTLKFGLPAADARVPPTQEPVERAASMIGQFRIVASPLAMAGVAATVADGRWRAPRLLGTDARRAGPRIAASEIRTLRRLMRDVVTSGTGEALSSVKGQPIGKSGTAEYGGGDPPPTHAWFVAARDDVAAAVLVEGGRSGSEIAAPIAARFFAGLDLARGEQ